MQPFAFDFRVSPRRAVLARSTSRCPLTTALCTRWRAAPHVINLYEIKADGSLADMPARSGVPAAAAGLVAR